MPLWPSFTAKLCCFSGMLAIMQGGEDVEEQELLRRFQSGEEEAQDELLRRYGGMMEYIVRGVLPDPQQARDCLADLRSHLWEKALAYDGDKGALSTWLTAVCRNAAFDHRRAQLRRETQELSPRHRDPAPGPEEQVLHQERTEQLRRALAQLKAGDRQLFYRKYYYLQSTAQIASELGLTQRAVEGRLYRVRKQLQHRLGGDRP